MSREGYVLETLLSVLPWRSNAFFYRTAAGAEIDLVLEHHDGSIWAVEIKRALSARVERGFHQACGDIEPARAFVVHAGDDRYPISEGIEGISVRALAEALLALSRETTHLRAIGDRTRRAPPFTPPSVAQSRPL